MYRRIILISGLLSCCFAALGEPLSFAETPQSPAREQLLGGDFVDPSGSALAFIATRSYTCSGVLVGTRHVLTAAHCVSNEISPPLSEFVIVVGGREYSVSRGWYNGGFNWRLAALPANTRYDIALLELSLPVLDIAPIPVMFDLPVKPGWNGAVLGFGTNELSLFQAFQGLGAAKAGEIVVSQVLNGIFSSHYLSSGVVICAGDSGGPVVSVVGRQPMVIGINSSSNSFDDYGVCEIGGGSSNYVDLQSQYSREFLSYFPDVLRVSGGLALFQVRIGALQKRLARVKRSSNLSQLRKAAYGAATSLKRLIPLADQERRALLQNSINNAKNISKASSTSAAQRAMRSLNKQLTVLQGMGLE